MTDYNKLTVKDLKALLKERDIPQTGLTRKAQYVEALEKADATGDAPGEEEVEQEQEGQGGSARDEEIEEPEEKPDGKRRSTRKTAQAETTSTSAEKDLPANMDSPISREPISPKTESYRDGDANGGETPKPPYDAPLEQEAKTTMQDPKPDATEDEPITKEAEPATQDVEPTAETSQTWGEPPTVPASRTLTHTSTLDSVRTEEMLEDRMKRKRRSASPPVSDTEIAQKRQRQDVDGNSVHLRDDLSRGGSGEVPGDVAKKDTAMTAPAGPRAEGSQTSAPAKERGGRYKDLLPPTPATTQEQEAVDADDRAVAPALHPASRAVYISNLQRPLNPSSLRSHLITLAAPPDSDPDTAEIQAFFVDSVKSHAYALFSTVQAAARVRASLHDRAWPPERDRKSLWVDFIPEDKCEEWIAFEGDVSNGRGTRWEVTYDNTAEGVSARLVEFGASARRPERPSQQDTQDKDRRDPQPAPSRDPLPPARRPEPARPVAPRQPEREAQKFVNLDKAFRSTTAKPKLYFLPVAKDLAEKRLDEFDGVVSRDWSAKRGAGPDGEQLRRYTFEDGDVLVDTGLHPVPGGRGGRFSGAAPRRGGYGRDDGGRGSYRPR